MKNVLVQFAMLTVLTLLLVNGVAGVAFGTVIYQDNFDNVAVGPFTFPSPQVGTRVSGNAVVRTGAVTPPSTPNYLENNRNNDVQPIIAGMRGDLDGSPLGAGTPVHAEAMIYAMDGYPVFGINADATNQFPWDAAGSGDGSVVVSGAPDGTVYAVGPTGGLVDTGLDHLLNTWQLWQIDYVVGASSYTLTVGGNSANLGAGFMADSAATQVGAVFIETFSGSTRELVDDLRVNAVPEPECLTLICMGSGIVLLWWNKRRGLQQQPVAN
ncbi:MAG: hypothetical protein IT427_09045 [Pirellulales bacterium]|nr:hypothetical protein [Pirellulales bacterium]